MLAVYTKVDLLYFFHIGLFFGLFVGLYGFWVLKELFFDRKKRYEELIQQVRSTLKYDDSQVITLTDLVLETKLKPSECRQFLDKLVVELDADVNYTKSGKVYYQFPTTKALNRELMAGKEDN